MPGSDRRQDMGPEPPWNGISGIEPPTVGTTIEPMGHYARDIIGDGRFSMIERDKLTMALERRIVGFFAQNLVRRRDQAKPRGFRGMRTVCNRALEPRMF